MFNPHGMVFITSRLGSNFTLNLLSLHKIATFPSDVLCLDVGKCNLMMTNADKCCSRKKLSYCVIGLWKCKQLATVDV